jgi:MFS family permease
MFDALRHREYRLIWYGQIFASMATWMDQVARGWLLYELTNSALQLGLVRGVQAIPLLLLTPLAGSTADRYSRKMQVLVAQVVDGLLYAAVAVLIFSGNIEPWHVYVTAIGMSVVQAFQLPSRAAMIGDAVPANHLTNAIGL